MGNPKSSIKTCIVFSIAVLLSACGQLIPILFNDTELTLGGDQTWSIRYTMVLPNETEFLVGQNQETWDQIISDYESRWVKTSWEVLPQKPNETKIDYRKSNSQANFDSLNQVEFHHSNQPLPFMKGSKHLSANAVLMDMGIVQWTLPFREVIVIRLTATDLTWLWIVLLVLSGIGFIVAGFGVSGKLPKRQQKMSSPIPYHPTEQFPSPLPTDKKYCPQCGTANPQEAGFCIKCGFQFPSQ